MNRIDFMKELEYLLQDIPDEEKADALAYYQDYLDEAGDEHEDQAIREFGSPERVAAIIRSELYGNLEEGGGFTETGYQDERFKDPRYQVAPHRELPDVSVLDESKKRSRVKYFFDKDDTLPIKLLKLAAVLIAASIIIPLLFGVGSAVLSVAATVLLVIVVLVLLLAFGTILFCLMAVVVIVLSISIMFINPASGIFLLGCGIFLLGCSFIGIVLSVLVYGRMVPFCFSGITDTISRMLRRNKRGV